jgi:hypothetical protein
MKSSINRRDFLKLTAAGGIGMGLHSYAPQKSDSAKKIKVGIIGLDTSHSIHFTKILNDPDATSDLAGCSVVAAYPKGSLDIKSSASRIPKYTKQMKAMGIDIVNSEEELLDKVDAVLLETNDGRRHLGQALKVFKAGKPMFIDKPLAAHLTDVLAIFDAAKHYNVPVFSASSLRYMKSAQAIRHGKVGTLLGAETYGPAAIEPTHTPLYWMGIHGVETLFTVMKTGCKSVREVYSEGSSVVVGRWKGDRLGTFRGLRLGAEHFGGTAFGEEKIVPIGPYGGYKPLLVQIVKFFRTGIPPVTPQETIEIYAFMSAAAESKCSGGKEIMLDQVLAEAKRNEVLDLK